jgi:endo-1,4-beta-xylanase
VKRREFLAATAGAVAASAFDARLIVGGRPWKGVPTVPSAEQTLREAGAGRGLLVGSSVAAAQLNAEADLAALVAQQCSIIVAENDMKWRWTQPEANRFDFSRADVVAVFAEKNGLKLRGHNLCWHQSLPEWFEKTATKENAARLLRQHILVVAGRYAGKMHSWDVVNEAIEIKDGRNDGLRESLWMKLLGPEYLAIAFHTAAETDPAAKLTYNDYGLEEDGKYHDDRRAAALGLLRWFRENKIPIHALGLQSHLHEGSSGNYGALHKFLDQVSGMGLEVYVTELDVRMEGSGESAEKRAGKIYREYLDNVLRHPAVKAVLTWGMSRRGRGKEERLLPFGDSLQPTPAFFAMQDALGKS